ncbi:hypothetical protein HNO89_003156 [Sporosarcina luteola]|nr:hypothetical protein [Sporosarcina luteola]
MTSRFNDIGETIDDFFQNNDKLLECIRCQRMIVWKHTSCTISCTHCGYILDIGRLRNAAPWRRNERICYAHRLWLRTPCCGEELWAFNKEHLLFLESYITSKLRSRKPNRNQSLASRLPRWMKDASNKNELIKAIERLKKKLL